MINSRGNLVSRSDILLFKKLKTRLVNYVVKIEPISNSLAFQGNPK